MGGARRRQRRPEALLRNHDAWEPRTDKLDFQWRARLLQSLWRQDKGLVAGSYREKVRGALLPMPAAAETLANYLTPEIRDVVRREVLDPSRARGKLYGKPRIFNNLLSSQPLCFNLFGLLSNDLDLATRALRPLSRGRIATVTEVAFEFSPGRGDERYTGDRSAFDVYVRFETPEGGRGFAGIEVKYHEGLGDPVASHRKRYDELADLMDCFKPESRPLLRQRPLQQIWRDHLLVGAHQEVDQYDDAFFVFLFHQANDACAEAVNAYRDCLSDDRSFQPWLLGDVAGSIRNEGAADWYELFAARYLAMNRVEALCETSA